MTAKMIFNPVLDGDTVAKLGLLEFEVRDLHPFELYGIEQSDYWLSLLEEYWHYSLILSIFYVVLIYLGRAMMASRPPYDLRTPMTVWSSFLALASIMGTWRSLNVLVATVRNYGFYYSVCHPHFYYNSNTVWGFLFLASKPLELGDTAFIVLRKQPLSFLHWYHHITVMIYVVISFRDHSAPGHYFYVVNYAVHALMYTYYALKSLRVRMPPFVPILVTSVQLSQMVLGTGLLSYVLVLKRSQVPCQIRTHLLYLGLAMYLSYFILFGHFFYHAYFRGNHWASRPTSVRDPLRSKSTALHNGASHSNGAVPNGKKHF